MFGKVSDSVRDDPCPTSRIFIPIGSHLVDSKHVSQLCLRFGTEPETEAALKLFKSHLHAVWEGDIGPAEFPARLHDTTPPNEESKEICISLGFQDYLEDVKNAVVPLGAVSVRLCKVFRFANRAVKNLIPFPFSQLIARKELMWHSHPQKRPRQRGPLCNINV